MHTFYAHGDPEARAAALAKRQLTLAAKRNGNGRAAEALVAAQPHEVQAELAARQAAPSGALRKRRKAAREAGMSEVDFLSREIELIEAMMRRRAEGRPNPGRVAKGASLVAADRHELSDTRPVTRATADDLFARIGRATDALFPQRVPSDRIIELAEWQALTLRMMQR
jgi:hypothetical protein